MRIQFASPGFREVEKIDAKPIPDPCRGFKQKTIVFETPEYLDNPVLVAHEKQLSFGYTALQKLHERFMIFCIEKKRKLMMQSHPFFFG